jgi:hypothetical protein
MPAPVMFPPGMLPEPPLRAAKAIIRAQQQAASSIPRKALWFVVALGLGIVIAAAVIAQGKRETDAEQAWFWSPEWLDGEAQADAELIAGKTTQHESDEAFEKALADRMKPE